VPKIGCKFVKTNNIKGRAGITPQSPRWVWLRGIIICSVYPPIAGGLNFCVRPAWVLSIGCLLNGRSSAIYFLLKPFLRRNSCCPAWCCIGCFLKPFISVVIPAFQCMAASYPGQEGHEPKEQLCAFRCIGDKANFVYHHQILFQPLLLHLYQAVFPLGKLEVYHQTGRIPITHTVSVATSTQG